MKQFLNDKLLKPFLEFYEDDTRSFTEKFLWTGFVIMFVLLLFWGLI